MIARRIARNLIALKKTPRESHADYLDRLQFEARRRTRHLIDWINPLSRHQLRRDRMIGPMGLRHELQRYQLAVLTAFGLEPHHRVLDIGCGPLTAGLGLIARLDRGGYVGVDLRQEPLAEAYRLVAEHGLADKNPTLVSSRSFGRDELGGRTFDFIWVSQLSYHLDDGEIAALFAQIRARMMPTSKALIDVIDPAIELAPDAHWRGFPYHVRPYGFFEEAAAVAGLSATLHGAIRDHGYPPRINLSANRLLLLRLEP
jgi:SAM-dependent methyltransferase